MEIAHHTTLTQPNTYYLYGHVDKVQLKPLIKGARRAMANLELNFSQVNSIDRASLKALITLLLKYRKQNLRVSLVDITAPVQTYLELTQVDKLFATVSPYSDQLHYSA